MVILQVVCPAMIMWSSGHGAAVTPVVGGLVFPYILKLSFSITVVRKTYCDLMHASRLFFFQLTHIAFHADVDARAGPTTRFQRALRLVYERLARASSEADDHSLHSLSMIAL